MPALHIEDLPEKEKLKMEVEQLRKEVKLQRQQVSKCSEEIKNYIEERSGEDPLVKGIPEDKNPLQEKGSCVISLKLGENCILSGRTSLFVFPEKPTCF
ncbi:PREDICTED: LOW QUALITY PROTEIN: guanine nucleotide-binding protein G(I)/G(S)/G(O) subunit gamma-11 [Cercocebus atys]|uniref:LOW QUALITY PROTEIN: guanine nucleotide-binding protein G(I)/G(S)/G(O) subunit gamma-11 n=1 Tax=Cercocebus atys TaxID=9531 RepID=UPI0005F4AF6D|nr:PREDICTED: LOW QUALITY PROTEIN: guanine nucleotide-binding protein G(I)/G(S)/G(O) subunit gamma-11 [Cercocebus atys]